MQTPGVRAPVRYPPIIWELTVRRDYSEREPGSLEETREP
jgi:hypothetical protein